MIKRKDTSDKKSKAAKEKYELEVKGIEDQYHTIMDKANNEYDEKSVPIINKMNNLN